MTTPRTSWWSVGPNAGVIECAVRNRAVFERIGELEAELAQARAENAKLKARAEALQDRG